MIKAKNGRVTFKGSQSELLTDYSTITAVLVDALLKQGLEREHALHLVSKAHNIGLMSKEEVEEEVRKITSKILKDIADSINEYCDEEEKADE